MDNPIKTATSETKTSSTEKTVESTVTIKRKEFSDGGYEETRVEQVEGGFIVTVSTHKKVNGEWTWTEQKSVSTEDPNKDTSAKGIADRLASLFKD